MDNNEKPRINLSSDQIESLTEMGFAWDLKKELLFNNRLEDLKAYKTKHGHCNVSQSEEKYKSLGKWCSDVRRSRRKLDNNEKPNINLSNDQIKSLTQMGFVWNLNKKIPFNNRLEDLKAYKTQHGHCNVSTSEEKYKSLGNWCIHVRTSRRKMDNNEKPHVNLSNDQIKILTEMGFAWNLKKNIITVP